MTLPTHAEQPPFEGMERSYGGGYRIVTGLHSGYGTGGGTEERSRAPKTATHMSMIDDKELLEQKQTCNEDTMQDKLLVQTLFHKTTETMDTKMHNQAPEENQSKLTKLPQNKENKRNQTSSTNIDNSVTEANGKAKTSKETSKEILENNSHNSESKPT